MTWWGGDRVSEDSARPSWLRWARLMYLARKTALCVLCALRLVAEVCVTLRERATIKSTQSRRGAKERKESLVSLSFKIPSPPCHRIGLAGILLTAALLLRRQPQLALWLMGGALLLLYLGGNHLVSMQLTYIGTAPQALAELPRRGDRRACGCETEQAGPRPTPEVNEAGERLLNAQSCSARASRRISCSRAAWFRLTTPLARAPRRALKPRRAYSRRSVLPHGALWLEGNWARQEKLWGNKKLLDPQGIQGTSWGPALNMPAAVAIFEKQGFEVIRRAHGLPGHRSRLGVLPQPDWRIRSSTSFPRLKISTYDPRVVRLPRAS